MRLVWILVGTPLLIGTAAPNSALCDDITIEAENYIDSHDIANSPFIIYGYYLEGLDYPDEWTEYDFQVGDQDSYSAHVTMRGAEGITCVLQLVFSGDMSGDTQTCEVSFLGTGTS